MNHITKDFSQLKKNLKKDFSKLKLVKIAVLGDTATQFLVQAMRGLGYEHNLNLEIFAADFSQIEHQLYDPSSDVYKFRPEIVIIFKSSHKLLGKYNSLNPEECNSLAQKELEIIKGIYSKITGALNAKALFYNYPEINDSVYGSYANKIESSFLFQLRKLNYELMCLASKSANFYLCDLSSLQNQIGKAFIFQPSIFVNAEMVLSVDALPLVADLTIAVINAINGRLKKCLIIDLDNTIWGGIIGDDGMENIQIGDLGIGKAFTEFQFWVKKLKNRGIIIAVCSKNTESVAKEPFEKHRDMILRLDDISVFVANWENKVDNLIKIRDILNIGFDSMVFLDDNPVERMLVRENIPEMVVPELPVDPADYLEYLYTLNLFETASVSNEDLERTKFYQIEEKRIISQREFTKEGDFLQSLNMHAAMEPFNKFNTPRIAQLSQRSNQFNLRTVRYTDADIENLLLVKDHFTFSFSLEDKFGDHGQIAAVVLRNENETAVFIENWFMSCRVLNRGMENFILNTIVKFARSNGFIKLIGEFVPTSKNEMVKDHYLTLGFEKKGDYWELELSNYQIKKNYIKNRG